MNFSGLNSGEKLFRKVKKNAFRRSHLESKKGLGFLSLSGSGFSERGGDVLIYVPHADQADFQRVTEPGGRIGNAMGTS